eukprot:TRINITY_DN10145_c0_g1_i1.p1 TRINITY_DN10145_c0_g1~~TRINITY_DN10145_c0_g1_i1.p1  ORF type:complete len:210 (-),score=4.76 TRINITY_DN10145_c0_g1_i1:194-823(-)
MGWCCVWERVVFIKRVDEERHYKYQSDILKELFAQGKIGKQRLTGYSDLPLQPTCARKQDASHEVWEKELEMTEDNESVKNVVTFPGVRNCNKLSDKYTSKSNTTKSVQFSSAKSEARVVASTLRSNRLKSQINQLNWERIKLNKSLIILVEDKQLIKSAYLQLSHKKNQLAASKESRGYIILKQENSISQALKEREKTGEARRGTVLS